MSSQESFGAARCRLMGVSSVLSLSSFDLIFASQQITILVKLPGDVPSKTKMTLAVLNSFMFISMLAGFGFARLGQHTGAVIAFYV